MELAALRMFKTGTVTDDSTTTTASEAPAKKAKKRLPFKQRALRETIKMACLWVALSPLVARPMYMGMLFQPDTHDYSELSAYPLKQLHDELKVVTQQIWFKSEQGERLNGLYFTKPGAKRTFIVCHGNAGNVAHRIVLAAALLVCNVNVLLFDYQGYGKSEGKPSIDGIVRDSSAAYDYAVKELKIAPSDIVLYGESLGCAAAAQVSKQRNVAGIILQSPFASLLEAGRERLPWLWSYPQSWFGDINSLNTAAVFEQPHAPLLLIHGTADPILNPKYSQSIFAAAVEPKKLVVIQNFGHAVCEIGAPTFSTAIRDFVGALKPATSIGAQ
jgi:fermentation-respiration switch protein FrsA (DUF1100 family)